MLLQCMNRKMHRIHRASVTLLRNSSLRIRSVALRTTSNHSTNVSSSSREITTAAANMLLSINNRNTTKTKSITINKHFFNANNIINNTIVMRKFSSTPIRLEEEGAKDNNNTTSVLKNSVVKDAEKLSEEEFEKKYGITKEKFNTDYKDLYVDVEEFLESEGISGPVDTEVDGAYFEATDDTGIGGPSAMPTDGITFERYREILEDFYHSGAEGEDEAYAGEGEGEGEGAGAGCSGPFLGEFEEDDYDNQIKTLATESRLVEKITESQQTGDSFYTQAIAAYTPNGLVLQHLEDALKTFTTTYTDNSDINTTEITEYLRSYFTAKAALMTATAQQFQKLHADSTVSSIPSAATLADPNEFSENISKLASIIEKELATLKKMNSIMKALDSKLKRLANNETHKKAYSALRGLLAQQANQKDLTADQQQALKALRSLVNELKNNTSKQLSNANNLYAVLEKRLTMIMKEQGENAAVDEGDEAEEYDGEEDEGVKDPNAPTHYKPSLDDVDKAATQDAPFTYPVKIVQRFASSHLPGYKRPGITKVSLHGYIDHLRMSPEAKKRFAAILTPLRFNAKTGTFRLSTNQYPTREQNERYLQHLLHDIVTEARKADLGEEYQIKPEVKQTQKERTQEYLRSVLQKRAEEDELAYEVHLKKWSRIRDKGKPYVPATDVYKVFEETRAKQVKKAKVKTFTAYDEFGYAITKEMREAEAEEAAAAAIAAAEAAYKK